MLTANGRIHLRRVRWHAAGEGSRTPIDVRLDRAERTFSQGVREMLCRLNQCSSSFEKTAENLARLTPIEISGESVRQLVEQEGRRAAGLVRRGRLKLDWSARDCRSEQGTSRIYLGCDGVKVPMVTDAVKRKRRAKIKQKRRRCGRRRRALPPLTPGADQAFKEFRVVAAYDETQKRRCVAATSGDCEAAGRLLRNVALLVQADQAEESIANVDGAPWIRGQLELHSVAQHIGLDYYHLKDYAQRTRRELYGEVSQAGHQWLVELMSTILEQGVDPALDLLIACRKKLRGRKRQAADRLIGYIAERREMIRYPEFKARGWQIGSGPLEAQCKTTTLRLKGRGRRWNKANAEALMALAALEASRLWDSWWKTPDSHAA